MPPVLPAASSPSHRRDAENVQPTSWRRSFLRHSPFPQRKSIWYCLPMSTGQELIPHPRATLATAGQIEVSKLRHVRL